MKAMILAAGRGERLRPLTDTIPKPLLKMGDKLLIEHHLIALSQANFKEIVINVSYFPDQFIEKIGNGEKYNLQIQYSFEPENAPLETGGGIVKALPLLGDKPFAVISADLRTDYPFEKLPHHLQGLAHLVLVDNPPHHPTGDFCLKGDRVCLDGPQKFNFGGIAVLSPQLFSDCKIEKFSYPKLFYPAIEKKLITGEHYRGCWVNVGSIEQLMA